jgi:hypothetical protein
MMTTITTVTAKTWQIKPQDGLQQVLGAYPKTDEPTAENPDLTVFPALFC